MVIFFAHVIICLAVYSCQGSVYQEPGEVLVTLCLCIVYSNSNCDYNNFSSSFI